MSGCHSRRGRRRGGPRRRSGLRRRLGRTERARARDDARRDPRTGAGGAVVVTMSGDLDIGRVATLPAQLLDARRSLPTGIVVDLSAVTFCDLTCLRTLAHLGRRANAAGIWFHLAGPSPIVLRVLEITGLVESLPCFADVETALRGGPRSTDPRSAPASR